MIKPFDYQEKAINEILEKFKINNKLCLQMPTGAGKTITFAFLAKQWRENNKSKVVILCHREELISQSAEVIVKLGMTYEKVLPSVKRYHHTADCYICMIETLDRRLKKNPRFLLDVGLIISDEAHVQIFNKVYNYFPKSKILGVTATPVLGGRTIYWKCERCNSVSYELGKCCTREMMEWSKPRTMSEVYEDIILGPKISYLQEIGQLVKEINFVQKNNDLSKLEIDSSGEFSTKSQDDVFGSDESSFNVLLNYENICKGKRTIIFNNSTKTNLKVYEDFKKSGYNVKLFDSVNSTDLSRKETVEWFRNNDDAILCNCGVFVAGVDIRSIQAEILNLATTSLSRYIQMVGRIIRSCDEIYKQNAILIDGGGNVDRFGIFSDDTRDWERIFREGLGVDKPKKEQTLSVSECKNCGMLYSKNTNVCPECGESKPIVIKERVESEEILQPIDNIPLPNGAKISTYVKSKEGDIFMAFAIMTQQIVDLFMYHGVSRDRYEKWKGNGKLDKRIGEVVRPCYFVFLSEFRGDGKRTLKQVLKKVGEKLDKYYGI